MVHQRMSVEFAQALHRSVLKHTCEVIHANRRGDQAHGGREDHERSSRETHRDLCVFLLYLDG